jgi:hypothetical protein
MLGAVAGDVIGSVHERLRTKTKNFPLFTPESRFTDDTVLTAAIADCLLHGRDYVDALHDYFHAYPDAGYGGTFYLWASTRRREPYKSWATAPRCASALFPTPGPRWKKSWPRRSAVLR